MQGGLDSPLTEEGVRQTEALGLYLKKSSFTPDLWFSSPQGRARQTSAILQKHLFPAESGTAARIPDTQLPEIIFDDRLREITCGTAEGKHRSELNPEMVQAIREDPFQSYSGGESMHDAYIRCLSFREYFEKQIASLKTSEHLNILIVAHGHLNRALAAAFTGMEASFSLTLTMENTGLSVLKGPEMKQNYRIHLWNQTVHLENF